MIGIVDYGCGNLRSLENALAAVGLSWARVGAPDALAGVDLLILPGVGHFGHAMANLAAAGLDRALLDLAGRGGRIMGICLGLQLLFEGSAEAPGSPGLGLLPGRCVPLTGPGLKVPHMGWSRVCFQPGGGTAEAYFVHSYCLRSWPPGEADELTATAEYGGPLLAALRRGNLAGCQFHPEKSGRWGLAFLKEFLTWS